MLKALVVSCVCAAALSGCGGAAGQTDAQKTAAALSGADKLAAEKNPQCKLFTPAEIAKFVGEAVSPGRDAAMGSGCQWLALNGSGNVLVQVVPARYHEPPSAADGFKRVPDVGGKGFVVPEMGGWGAGAIAGEQAVRVSLAGAAASEANAIALLTETIKRRSS